MTLYHFGNCLALSYVPYYLTYKHAGLSEYGAFWRCVQTIVIYALTQLVKMLVLATFFPVPALVEGQSVTETVDVLKYPGLGPEFLKSSIDVIDLVGVYFALARIPGRGHSKILTAAMGWGVAELVFTRFLVLWVGARGVEFSWKYIQMSLESNIALVQHIVTAALVWLWTRHDLKGSYVPMVSTLLVLGNFKPMLVQYACHVIGFDSWIQLIFEAAITGILSLITTRIYVTVQ